MMPLHPLNTSQALRMRIVRYKHACERAEPYSTPTYSRVRPSLKMLFQKCRKGGDRGRLKTQQDTSTKCC